MPKFRVHVEEVHIATVWIEAANEKEARQKVNDKIEEESVSSEYSYTRDPEEWLVLPG